MSELPDRSVCQLLVPSDLGKSSQDYTLIDVRSPIEFEAERIADSINIPLELLEASSDEVPRSGQLVVICRSGKRAERGAYALMKKGLKPMVLEGGLLAWRKAGLPVKEGKKMLSIERQIQLVVGLGVLSGVLMGALLNPWFLVIPGFFGAGLTFAGLSGTCALGILLGKAPWNRLPVYSSGGETACEKNEPKSGCCA